MGNAIGRHLGWTWQVIMRQAFSSVFSKFFKDIGSSGRELFQCLRWYRESATICPPADVVAGRGGSPLSGWSAGNAASSNTKQPADGSRNPAFFGGGTRFRLHPILTPDNQLHGFSEVFLFMAVTVEA